jgi:hypothetical protein
MSARHTHICRCSPHRSWIVTDINRKCTDSFDYNLSPHVFLLLYGKESPSSQCFCYLYSRIVLLLRAKNYYHIYIMALPPALASSHHWPQIIIYPSIWTNINELLLLSYHSPVSLCCNVIVLKYRLRHKMCSEWAVSANRLIWTNLTTTSSWAVVVLLISLVCCIVDGWSVSKGPMLCRGPMYLSLFIL